MVQSKSPGLTAGAFASKNRLNYAIALRSIGASFAN
jgi:hypothetical protein